MAGGQTLGCRNRYGGYDERAACAYQAALASPGGARESAGRSESYTRVSDHLTPAF